MSKPRAARTSGRVCTGPGISSNMGQRLRMPCAENPPTFARCLPKPAGWGTYSPVYRGGRTMITKFDSLYAGHVDLENIGYGGTPINDRLYDNDHLSTALSKAEAMARKMDSLG